jgi:hypothetical protein
MSKCSILLLVCLVPVSFLKSQSIFKSAESKSGILVGTQNESAFAGISYENASDEVSFDYKWIKQNSQIIEGKTTYPDYDAFNVELVIDTDKSQAAFVLDNKWQGGLELSFTYASTIDEQAHGKTVKKRDVKLYYTGLKDGDNYDDEIECLKKNDSCYTGKELVEYFIPERKLTKVFFVSGGNQWGRINTVTLNKINADTTLANFDNPGSNTTYLDFGYNWFKQIYDRGYLSLAGSFRTALVVNSSRGLKKTNVESLSGTYFSSKDLSQYIGTGTEQSYFVGETGLEGFIIPRFDLFYRHDLGENKPYLGIIGAVSPLYSSTKNVWRWNAAVGPSFSPDTMPDQVVFALLNQWIEDDKGKMVYSLSFRASFPISFD